MFTFTNSVDRDEMQHYVAFYLGLHCLQNYSFRGFPNTKGLPGKSLFIQWMKKSLLTDISSLFFKQLSATANCFRALA